jgi:hypothetical protein
MLLTHIKADEKKRRASRDVETTERQQHAKRIKEYTSDQDSITTPRSISSVFTHRSQISTDQTSVESESIFHDEIDLNHDAERNNVDEVSLLHLTKFRQSFRDPFNPSPDKNPTVLPFKDSSPFNRPASSHKPDSAPAHIPVHTICPAVLNTQSSFEQTSESDLQHISTSPLPLLDPQKLHAIVDRIGLKLSIEWAENLLNCKPVQTSPADAQLIKEAADFFLAVAAFDLAFPLYLSLWLTGKTPDTELECDILLYCAASASTISELSIMKNILIQEAESETGVRNELQQFILCGLVTIISLRLGHINTYKDYLSKAREIYSSIDEFIDRIRQDSGDEFHPTVLDLNSYYVVRIIFRSISENDQLQVADMLSNPSAPIHLTKWLNGNLKLLELKFLRQSPGPFGLDSGKSVFPWLRAGLEWCRDILRTTYQLPRQWKSLQTISRSKHWTESVAIFGHLWTKWFPKKSTPESSIFWTSTIQNITGISGAEFLYEMSSLMLEMTPQEDKSRKLHRGIISKELNLIHRAIGGVDFLLKLDDKQLAEVFLTSFIRESPHSIPEPEMAQFCSLCLEIFDLGAPTSSASRGRNLFGFTTPVMSNFGLNATFTSSNSSLTLSSMGRQSIRNTRQSLFSMYSQQSPDDFNFTLDRFSDRFSGLAIPENILEEPTQDDV